MVHLRVIGAFRSMSVAVASAVNFDVSDLVVQLLEMKFSVWKTRPQQPYSQIRHQKIFDKGFVVVSVVQFFAHSIFPSISA